ncbi:MAG: aminotransferase class I/II-fold pyridoxal phosphate-dependent enzyme [Coxiellaceae bacterium]|nr:aminotransferase class I/II-fold pyridoxal phosphate-dependent enzyme [Coxiellaceae bacterium]
MRRKQTKKTKDFGIGSTHIKIATGIKRSMKAALAATKSPYPTIPATLTTTVFDKAGIAKSLRRYLGVTYGAGVRPLITAALQHLVNQGKLRFVVPMPNWLSYQPLIEKTGGHCLPIDIIPLAKDRRRHFSLYLKQLDALLLHANVFVFTPYNNPSGIQYTAEETAAIARLLKKHRHVSIIVDDIYRELCPTVLPSFLAQYPEFHERCIYIAGTTKSHSLRAGYAIAPQPIAHAMDEYLRLVFGTPLAKYELAGLKKALTTSIPTTKVNRLFKKRDLLIRKLADIHRWNVVNKTPDGGNYVLVNVEQDMKRLHCDTASEYATKLKTEAKIIAIPIEKYHLRFCVRVDSKVLSVVKQIKAWQKTAKPRLAYSPSQLLRNLSFLNTPRPSVIPSLISHSPMTL